MSTTSGVPALSGSGRSLLLRWIVAILGFPIGGFIGHLDRRARCDRARGADLRPHRRGDHRRGPGACAGVRFGRRRWRSGREQPRSGWAQPSPAVTAVIGQIDTQTEAIVLGAISGLALGAGQAALLMREHVANAWMWVVASGVAWAAGWAVTSGIGVALASGWPVYGLSGALVSQIITGLSSGRSSHVERRGPLAAA